MPMTRSGLDRTQDSYKAGRGVGVGVWSKQVLQGKLSVDGLFIHCFKGQSVRVLANGSAIFLCVKEEFCCQKLKEGCRN